MINLSKIIFSIFFLFWTMNSFANENSHFHGWIHIELGAGNYGQDGHTQVALSKHFYNSFKEVSNLDIFNSDIEKQGQGNYQSEAQYGILFRTLDQLIQYYGTLGVFHINDLHEEYARCAKEALQEYATSVGYHSIIIEIIAGDYANINAAQILSKYGRSQYSSAHLKNPELSFYNDRMDGNSFYASKESRAKARSLLKKLASLSETGLYFFILDREDFAFIPDAEKTEFMEKGIFYQKTEVWEAFPYIFPDGEIYSKECAKVFKIQ